MAELIKPWNDGGSLSATYNGSGDGEAIFTYDVNEGIDREMLVIFADTERSMMTERKVMQIGRREIFNDDFILSDGGTFNVLKDGL